jgi:hypothetical protein
MKANLVLLALLCAVAATGCANYYRPPAAASGQLASASVDKRATVLEVDGLPVKPVSGRAPKQFSIGAGCRTLMAKYEESYFIWGEKRAVRNGLGDGLAATLAETEVHSYETENPIRFFLPVRPGYRYWVTATFTGDEFIPRVVEIAANGDAVNQFLPDRPCPS